VRFFLFKTCNRNVLFLFAILFLNNCAYQNIDVDLIVHNAKIYTLDLENHVHQAMAIKDGKIVELGSERQILNKYSAKRSIDAAQKVIYPGFIDAHCHLLGYGRMLGEVRLEGTTSFDEVIQRVSAYLKERPNCKFVTGRGWDQNDWPVKQFPDNIKLSETFPNIPVVLRRIDGHALIANDVALQLAGIGAAKPVDGGEIITLNGRVSGVLIDNAMTSIDAIIPKRNTVDELETLELAQRNCLAVGLTTVDEAGLDRADIEMLQEAVRQNKLKLRVYAMLADNQENYDHYMSQGPIIDDRLTIRSFKWVMDGALGSRGACLKKPYEDLLPKQEYGKLLKPISYYMEKAVLLKEAGFQICTHAIGDSANSVALQVYCSSLEGSKDMRWRIEHAQVVDRNDINRFSECFVIPSVQPTHAMSDWSWAIERLGRNRIQTAYAYKDLLDQLGFLPLGTDFPIEDISPFKTLATAVFRHDAEGWPTEGWQLENAITMEQALRGVTIWAAMANFEENKKGSLEIGKLADFIIVDTDLIKATEAQVLSTKVIHTYINGDCVYSHE
jgi:predicted amidohydrolase YtcJ